MLHVVKLIESFFVGNLIWEVIAMVFSLMGVGFGIREFIYLFFFKKTRFWRNSNRKVVFFGLNDTRDVSKLLKTVKENGLFKVEDEIYSRKDYTDYLGTGNRKSIYIIDYDIDCPNKIYQDIAQDAKTGNDNIPIIIYSPHPIRVTDEHQAIFSVQPYCDTVNTSIRLLSQLVAIYEIMPTKKK